MSLMRTLSAAVIIAMVVVVQAIADVPSEMTVQGRLTDSTGAPLAPGLKTLSFSIHDAEIGGARIWPSTPSENHDVQTGNDGFWSVSIGSSSPLTANIFTDSSRWLEITVDDHSHPAETLPRLRLSTGPYAFHSAASVRADSATNSSLLNGLSSTAFAAVTHEHSLSDLSGELSSASISDEPGVASNDRHAEFALDPAGITALISRGLTAPADGYVLVMLTGEVIFTHANGTSNSAAFGLSTDNSAFQSIQNLTQLPSGAGTGTYKLALAIQTIVPVAPGPTTFYLLGQQISGTGMRVSDLELSLLFVPTAYGTVDPVAIPGIGPPTFTDVTNRNIDHLSTDISSQAEIVQELALLRAEVEVLRMKVDAK